MKKGAKVLLGSHILFYIECLDFVFLFYKFDLKYRHIIYFFLLVILNTFFYNKKFVAIKNHYLDNKFAIMIAVFRTISCTTYSKTVWVKQICPPTLYTLYYKHNRSKLSFCNRLEIRERQSEKIR